MLTYLPKQLMAL